MNLVSHQFLTIAAIATVGLAACEKPGATAQEKMNEAQAGADKVGAEARAEADKKANAAQADADNEIAGARADFAKLREDHRHTVTADLVKLDKKIAELDAKALTATGSEKTDLAAKLTKVHTRRQAFGTDLERLEASTATTWDAAKGRLDKAWTELEGAVDDV